MAGEVVASPVRILGRTLKNGKGACCQGAKYIREEPVEAGLESYPEE